MCPGRVRGGTQGRVEARPAWGNYRMPTGEAGTEEGGPTSLLLLGKFSQGVVEVEGGGGLSQNLLQFQKVSDSWFYPENWILKQLRGWRGPHNSVSEEW